MSMSLRKLGRRGHQDGAMGRPYILVSYSLPLSRDVIHLHTLADEQMPLSADLDVIEMADDVQSADYIPSGKYHSLILLSTGLLNEALDVSMGLPSPEPGSPVQPSVHSDVESVQATPHILESHSPIVTAVQTPLSDANSPHTPLSDSEIPRTPLSHADSPRTPLSSADTPQMAAQSPTHLSPSPAGVEDDLSQRQLDDIRVEYHPNSGRGTKIYRFEDYIRERPSGQTFRDPLRERPYEPFKSLEDFQFAELALENNLKKDHVELLLSMINRDRGENPTVSFGSFDDVNSAWKKAELFYPSVCSFNSSQCELITDIASSPIILVYQTYLSSEI